MALPSGVKRFNQDLIAFSKKLDLDIAIVTKKIAVDLFTAIVRKTPVLTGRARASWNLSAGKIDPSVFPENEIVDAATTARKVRSLKNKPFQKVFITNNLEYIVPLEEGHSDKAPLGMVAVSLQEVRTFIKGILSS